MSFGSFVRDSGQSSSPTPRFGFHLLALARELVQVTESFLPRQSEGQGGLHAFPNHQGCWYLSSNEVVLIPGHLATKLASEPSEQSGRGVNGDVLLLSSLE